MPISEKERYGDSSAAGPANFYQSLEQALQRRKLTLAEVCPPGDKVARRVLIEYGALFIAGPQVRVPPVCVFPDARAVEAFQRVAGVQTETVAGVQIELQPAAMKALLAARAASQEQGRDVTPRGGAEAARRTYDDTVRLWASRFAPGLEYWTGCMQLPLAEAERLRGLAVPDQVLAALELEERGCFFSKDFSKSILQSVAPPGASQHLAMLAFDVAEFKDASVRHTLARHGWFQTVQSDLPHFTFLGRCEEELPQLGLRRVEAEEQVFWVPNADD